MIGFSGNSKELGRLALFGVWCALSAPEKSKGKSVITDAKRRHLVETPQPLKNSELMSATVTSKFITQVELRPTKRSGSLFRRSLVEKRQFHAI
jgi:hypothetical protein